MGAAVEPGVVVGRRSFSSAKFQPGRVGGEAMGIAISLVCQFFELRDEELSRAKCHDYASLLCRAVILM